MKCIIIDDEPLALDLLESYISQIPYLDLAGRFRSAVDALAFIQNGNVDLIFSDIQMPGLNGIEFVETLTRRPMFIFITAHEQFAVRSYELSVIDYLLKPIAYERFLKACNKALEFYNLKLDAAHPVKETADYVFLQLDYKLVKVKFEHIAYIEAVRDYIKIHFNNGDKYLLIRMSMKALEQMLPTLRFLRIHKSFIIQTSSITALKKSSVFIGETELPISEQYRDTMQKFIDRRI